MKTFALLLLAPMLVWAHTGHGMGDGWHWHPSDTWGYLLMAAVVAFAVWGRRKK
jgi:hypothetical protein